MHIKRKKNSFLCILDIAATPKGTTGKNSRRCIIKTEGKPCFDVHTFEENSV